MLKEIIFVDTKKAITTTINPVITTTSGIESSQSVVTAQTDVPNASVTKPVLQPSSQQPVAPQASIPEPDIQQPVASSPGTQGNVPNVSVMKPVVLQPAIQQPVVLQRVVAHPLNPQLPIVQPIIAKPVLPQPIIAQPAILRPVLGQPIIPRPIVPQPTPVQSVKLKPLTSVESKPSQSDDISSNQQSKQENIKHIARINGMDYQVCSTVQNNEKTYRFIRVSGKRGLPYDPNDSGVLKMVSYMSTAFEMKIDLTKPYEQLVPVIIRVLIITINE